MTQTPEEPTGSDICIQDAAKMKFEAVGLTATDLMPRDEFLTQATAAYGMLRLAIAILNKTPEELVETFRRRSTETRPG